ncbi:MAG: hypothetical protein WC139_04305 [Candidatus Kapaibacterium sp.]
MKIERRIYFYKMHFTNISFLFNQIQWDGRDADGDYISNGVYFYRVVFKGSSEAVSDIRKLVVLK